MGGMSHGKLMATDLLDTGEDCAIELFQKSLRNDKKEEYDEYEDEEYQRSITIVGKKLHGPTFDDDYEEQGEKVGHLHIMHIVSL